jgi:hypothetical protein
VSGLVGLSNVMAFLAIVGSVGFSIFAAVAIVRGLSTQQRLLRHGEHAQARILQTELLPASKYGDRARFTLEVHRLDGRIYEAVCKHRVHALHAHLLQVGCLVDLRIDLARPNQLIVTGPSASSPSQERSPQRPRLLQAAAPSAQSLRREWPPTP